MENKKLNFIRNNNKKSAIIFIHGFLGDPIVTWGDFPKLIKNDFLLEDYDLYTFGYSTSLAPDIRGIWSSDAKIADLALLFKTESEISPLINYEGLVIISHSMGGLIIQKAIVESATLRERIKTLIMFGTPSKGLKKTMPFSWYKKQLKDMCENSEFVLELRKRWDTLISDRPNFNLCVCAGEKDEFVPHSSSLEPFIYEVRYLTNGNHIEIVKPGDVKSNIYRLVRDKILGNNINTSPYNVGAVLAELTHFEDAINKFRGKDEELDESSLVAYALALEGLGRRDEAIKILSNHRNRTDIMGTLAGRFKRLWLNEGIENFALKAYELYTNAYEISKYNDNKQQIYYQRINQSFLELVYFKNFDNAKEFALEAKKICHNLKLGVWEAATIGEANLHFEPIKALEYYKKIVQMKVEPWEIVSMYRQAEIICEIYGLQEISKNLYNIFTGLVKD